MATCASKQTTSLNVRQCVAACKPLLVVSYSCTFSKPRFCPVVCGAHVLVERGMHVRYTPSLLPAQLRAVSCGSGSQQCVNAPSAGASTCLTRARPDSESAARRVCSGACQLPRWSHGLQVGSTDTAVFASRTVVLLSPSRCCSGSYRSGPGKPHSKPRLSCTECVRAVGGARAATLAVVWSWLGKCDVKLRHTARLLAD